MSEYDLIRSFSKAFSRSPLQRNALFECDAEIIEIGNHLWALTMDDFSPAEDLFTAEDPGLLGANLATATLSDLLAAGATPEWFMHAVSLPRGVDEQFPSRLAAGIAAVFDQAGCSLCGGDTGRADTWRFCGFAMGSVQENGPLTRIMPCEPQRLWVTGRLGDANLAALTGSPTPRFELRLAEAETIRRVATACIDTSGGFMDSVWLLHTVNPSLRMEIDVERLPLAPGISGPAVANGFPPEAALLGGAGEYELLFAAPESVDVPHTVATCIGSAVPSSRPGVFIYRNGERLSEMTEPPPCPRDAEDVRDHVREVVAMAQRLFGDQTQ